MLVTLNRCFVRNIVFQYQQLRKFYTEIGLTVGVNIDMKSAKNIFVLL
jgi:hypothetical protein